MNEPCQNIIALLEAHAEEFGDDLCVELFSRRVKPESRTFAEVYASAGRAAATLQSRGLRRGDVLVMVGTHHIDFYAVWLGCVWLGAIPTVLAEPSVRIDQQVYWARLGELLERIKAWGLALARSTRRRSGQLRRPNARLAVRRNPAGQCSTAATCKPKLRRYTALAALLRHHGFAQGRNAFSWRDLAAFAGLSRITRTEPSGSHCHLAAALSRHGFHRLLHPAADGGSTGGLAFTF